MQVNPSEIARSYRQADNKQAQIKILSELNGCDEQKIKEILAAEGEELPRARAKRKPKEEPQEETRQEAPEPEIQKISGQRERELPEAVRWALEEEAERLRLHIMDLECKRDSIMDFLAGAES